ncbi:MAG: PAS-domain containing protein [Alphaproteobacteria bacterium]|nr:PAS-domain containing protein [Alphaproteobacteria bacterium]
MSGISSLSSALTVGVQHHLMSVLVIFILVLGAFIVMALAYFRLVKQNRARAFQEQLCEQISAHLHQGWLRWQEEGETFATSQDLAKNLGIPVSVASIHDFLELLDVDDQNKLRALIARKDADVQDEIITLPTRQGPRFFEVILVRHGDQASGILTLFLRNQDGCQRAIAELQGKIASKHDERTLMKEVLENLPSPLWVFDKETGKISYCNQAYADVLEMPKQQVIENSIHLGVQDSVEEFWQEGGSLKYLNIKGQRRCYEFKKVSIEGQGRILAFAFDRSAEDSLERKLKRHLSLYREVLETLSAGVTVYGPDRKLRFFNHAYARMFGMDESWLSSEPTMSEVLDDLNRRRLLVEYSDYPAFKRREMNILSGLLTPMQELCYLPDGRNIRKITAPHPSGGIFYIFEDVTNSLELERRCNTQLDVQRSTLDNLHEGIAVFGSDARLRFTNPSFRKLWNWMPDGDADRRHIRELIEHVRPYLTFEDEWEHYKERLISRVSDRVPKKRRLHRTDGVIIDFAYVPLPDGSHLLSFIDVTASCRMEELMARH